jgi:hypothetical protein
MNTNKELFYEKLKELEEEFPQYCIITWAPEDYKEFKDDLTEEDCIDLSEHLSNNHDANYGISWGTIEGAIDYLFTKYEEKNKDAI